MTHAGVNFINRGLPQPPSVIVREVAFTDIVQPTAHIYSGLHGEWENLPLLTVTGMTKKDLREGAEAKIGKKVQVLLPLQIRDTVNEYIFIFDVDGYTFKAKEPVTSSDSWSGALGH